MKVKRDNTRMEHQGEGVCVYRAFPAHISLCLYLYRWRGAIGISLMNIDIYEKYLVRRNRQLHQNVSG